MILRNVSIRFVIVPFVLSWTFPGPNGGGGGGGCGCSDSVSGDGSCGVCVKGLMVERRNNADQECFVTCNF